MGKNVTEEEEEGREEGDQLGFGALITDEKSAILVNMFCFCLFIILWSFS